jgi:hypothetical protein
MEKLGTPAIPLINPFFIKEAMLNARELGWPYPRIVAASEPNALRYDPAIQRIINGKDMISGKPFMTAVVDALTQPLNADEKKTGKLTHPIEPRILPVTGTEDELQKYFLENKMTDGLPVVLPTEEKVAAMLKGTSHPANEVVKKNFSIGRTANGQVEGRDITVEKVAVVAVMAGAKPEYFPVILALASYGPPISSSAQSFTGMAVVHGPIAKEIGMNSGFGCFGPYNHANATIGRAWQLMARNFAFAEPGLTVMGSWGNNLQYNMMTWAENLDDPVPAGWPPLYVEKGFKPTDSVVSVWSGRGFRQRVGFDVPALTLKALDNVTYGGGLVLLPAVSARMLAEEYGFATKDDFRKFIYDNTLTTIKEWKDTDLVRTFHITALETGRANPAVAEYLKQPDAGVVRRFYNLSDINIMVAGAGCIFFTQGGDFDLRKMVEIDPWR